MTLEFWKLRVSELSANLAVGTLLSIMTWDLVASHERPSYAAFALTSLFVSRLFFGFLLGPVSDSSYRMTVFRSAIFLSLVVALSMELLVQIVRPGLFVYIGEAFFLGVPHSNIQPIANAIVPSIVPEKDLERAFRNYFALQSVFGVLGILIGMVSLQTFGMSVALSIPVILSMAAFVVSISIKFRNEKAKSNYNGALEYLQGMLVGLKLLKRFRTEMYWGAASALVNSIITPIVALILPFFIAMHYHKQPALVALLEGSISVGVFIGATYGHIFTGKFSFKKRHTVQATFAVMGLVICILGSSASLVVWCISLLVLGIAIVVNNSIIEARRAIAIPERYRARIQLVHGLAIQSAIPAGLFLVGCLVGKVSLNLLLFFGGGVAILIAVFLMQIPGLVSLLELPDGSLDGCYEQLFPKPRAIGQGESIVEFYEN